MKMKMMNQKKIIIIIIVFMNIINNNKLESILRGKAMECIGMIGESVGIIKFIKIHIK